MTQPFHHLNIPYGVSDAWRKSITDFQSKQMILDNDILLLDPKAKEFLASVDLFPYSANFWSWLNRPPYVWHIDCPPGTGNCVAINYLLCGPPGATEWIDESLVKYVGSVDDSRFDTPFLRYNNVQNHPADFSVSIRPGIPMLIRSDIPHRVNSHQQVGTRWTYRIFLRRMSDPHKILSWDTVEELLSPYFIE